MPIYKNKPYFLTEKQIIAQLIKRQKDPRYDFSKIQTREQYQMLVNILLESQEVEIFYSINEMFSPGIINFSIEMAIKVQRTPTEQELEEEIPTVRELTEYEKIIMQEPNSNDRFTMNHVIGLIKTGNYHVIIYNSNSAELDFLLLALSSKICRMDERYANYHLYETEKNTMTGILLIPFEILKLDDFNRMFGYESSNPEKRIIQLYNGKNDSKEIEAISERIIACIQNREKQESKLI